MRYHERADEIVNLRHSGLSWATIYAMVQMPSKTVRDIYFKHPDAKKLGKRGYPPKHNIPIEDLRKCIEDGLTVREIADIFKVSKSLIQTKLYKDGRRVKRDNKKRNKEIYRMWKDTELTNKDIGKMYGITGCHVGLIVREQMALEVVRNGM